MLSCALLGALWATSWHPAQAQTSFATSAAGNLPPPPILVSAHGVHALGTEQSYDEPCGMSKPDGQVDLFEALRYALCANPRTRQAWAALQAQAAHKSRS